MRIYKFVLSIHHGRVIPMNPRTHLGVFILAITLLATIATPILLLNTNQAETTSIELSRSPEATLIKPNHFNLEYTYGIDRDTPSIIVSSTRSNAILSITETGRVELLARMDYPSSMAIDNKGNLIIIANYQSPKIYRLTPGNSLEVVVDNPPFLFCGYLAIDSEGNYIVSDPWVSGTRSVYRLSPNGIVLTKYLLPRPGPLAIDSHERYIVFDLDTFSLYVIDPKNGSINKLPKLFDWGRIESLAVRDDELIIVNPLSVYSMRLDGNDYHELLRVSGDSYLGAVAVDAYGNIIVSSWEVTMDKGYLPTGITYLYIITRDSKIHKIGPLTSINGISSIVIKGNLNLANLSIGYSSPLRDKVWEVFKFAVEGGVWGVSTSADGRYLVAAEFIRDQGQQGAIHMFQTTPNPAHLWTYKSPVSMRDVLLSDDGRYLVASGYIGYDGYVFLFNTSSSTPLWTFTVPIQYERGNPKVSITADGSYIVVSGLPDIYLFSKDSGKPMWKKRLTEAPTLAKISRDGNYIVASSPYWYWFNYSEAKPVVFVLNKNGDILWSTKLDAKGVITSLDLSWNGTSFALATSSGKIYYFKLDSREPVWSHEFPNLSGGGIGNAPIWVVAITSDGQYVVVGGGDSAIRMINEYGNILWTRFSGSESGGVWSVDISDNGYVVYGDAEHNCVFELINPYGVSLGSYSDDCPRRVTISKNGKIAATGFFNGMGDFNPGRGYLLIVEVQRFYSLTVKSPSVFIDGYNYTSTGEITIPIREGIHAIRVDSPIYVGTGTRLIFDGWYINGTLLSRAQEIFLEIRGSTTLEVAWRTEYFVSISTPYSSVKESGWYNKDSHVLVKVEEKVVYISYLTRQVFDHWEGLVPGDQSVEPGAIMIYVDGPRNLKAIWRTEIDYARLNTLIAISACILLLAISIAYLRRLRK
jgi:hypothetical protein